MLRERTHTRLGQVQLTLRKDLDELAARGDEYKEELEAVFLLNRSIGFRLGCY